METTTESLPKTTSDHPNSISDNPNNVSDNPNNTSSSSSSSEEEEEEDNNNINDTSLETTTTAVTSPILPDDNLPDPQPQPRKRRRRKKQFPEMIPSSGARIIRHKSTENQEFEYGFEDDYTLTSRRRRRASSDLDVETLIAISVGFPVDSLTEEEIEAKVVSSIGGTEQANYIVVRNHILSKWRSNVNVWLAREHALESIRTEHTHLVDSAYSFLLQHGYINFGLAAQSAANLTLLEGSGSGLDPEPSRGNVVVIGAGLAGLVAAKQLIFLGFKVVVLEGRMRPGGRVRTKKMTGGECVAAADLGGSVLTGINGNPLGVLARQLGLPLHKVRDICPLYLPNGKTVNPEIDSKVEVSFNKLLDRVCKLRQTMMEEAKSIDVPLGTALEAFRQVYRVAEDPQEKMLLDWHLANLEYANATLMSNLSMVFWDQDDPFEMGGDHCFIPGGNDRFIRALAENLPIFYNQTVQCVKYGSDGVLVYANGQEYHADMVLCTVPLGVLKKETIEFIPDLPQRKKDAIERLGFGLLNKVAILFPYDFWGGEIDTFGHLSDKSSMRGEFFLFYSYSSVAGGPLLVALVAGEAAIEFEKMSPVESVNRVMEILKGIFNPKGIAVPEPLQAICTRWGQDQFSYGSYSYVGIGASGNDYDILAESIGNGRLFFAGEATNKQYPATMHGAFLSGLREAANMLRIDKRRKTKSNVSNGSATNQKVEAD
uniref:lysine-specific histone demethylase 1 homolog 1 n=1 Tax=Erigeron canadensis TaxID=72917 RepID=UPI001CB8C126|nr:lysine-specific histone demethylase 1 homolog 1 [Erigeron canadensis]XP_043630855.1 lysine-specific histone demethylase 1 homolog 1 [Erigeron canadensis]XP_043630856.1 lysine-specific histone demethylase 1 homolog 1 [Erigeron canadensis]XP_043630857.1 lysine-specific histone demethylase 1 homolog 1 [Erigeron canadensis]